MKMTYSEAHRLFSYDPDNGYLHHKTSHAASKIGDIVGNVKGSGHLQFNHKYRTYLVHRVIWLMTHERWPSQTIDHINGCPTDNRLCNLREATHSQNSTNVRFYSRNTSGFRGVSIDKGGVWCFQIQANRKRIKRSGFHTAEAAHHAYLEHARLLHGEFAHHQQRRQDADREVEA